MYQFSKNTHLTIIGVFAVIFIVIYLYYTITDVRKLQLEVSRLSKEVKDLENKVQSSSGSSCPIMHSPVFIQQQPNVEVGEDDEEVDDESVGTEEIQHLLDQETEDDTDVQETKPVSDESVGVVGVQQDTSDNIEADSQAKTEDVNVEVGEDIILETAKSKETSIKKKTIQKQPKKKAVV